MRANLGPASIHRHATGTASDRLSSSPLLVTPLAVLLLAGFLLAVPAFGAPLPQETERWLLVETPIFHLVSNGDEERALELVRSLEELRRMLATLTPAVVEDAGAPTWIFAFKDADSYAPFRAQEEDSSRAAYLIAHPQGTYAALNGEGQTQAQLYVFKLYVQHLLLTKAPTLPLWLRTGIAEYYSSFQIWDDEAVLGSLGLRGLLGPKALRTIDLETLIREGGDSRPEGLLQARGDAEGEAASPEPGEGAQSHAFDIGSWQTVHFFLSSSDERRLQTRHFIGALLAGADVEVAFEAYFKFPLDELNERMLAHVEKGEFQILRVRLRPKEELSIKTRTLPPAEALAALGDLTSQVFPERPERGRAFYRRVLELDPEAASAWYGLAWIALQQDDPRGAAAHAEKALALDPDDVRHQFIYGDARLRTLGRQRPETEEELAGLRKAQEALRRAAELDPTYAVAWERLGFAANLDPEASQEGVTALEKAYGLLPGRTDVALNLLLAYARLGDRKAVDEVLTDLERLDAEEDILLRAREIRLQALFRQAAGHLRANELPDAIALFAEVEAETANEALQAQVQSVLEQARAVDDYNRFAALYQEARDKLLTEDWEAAEAALEALSEVARPGLQTSAVDSLQDRLEAGRGSSPGALGGVG